MTNYTRVLNSSQMAACDAYTIETLKVPSRTLMERAARGVVDYMEAHPEVFPLDGKQIAVLCGSGNNGGDGFAVAQLLVNHPGTRVLVCYVGARLPDGSPDTSRMSIECKRQYELSRDLLIPVFAPTHMTSVLSGTHVIVDAILGIGLDRPIEGELRDLVRLINESGLPVLSVDIPTGVSADMGEILGCAIKATATVTMQAIKIGLLSYPAAELCGNISVCDIGVKLLHDPEEAYFLADEKLLADVMPPRSRRTHKGTYGKLALVCGSEKMCGAAILAAKGALRSGVGLVHVFTPSCNKTAINVAIPEAIVTAYDPTVPPDAAMLREICACDGVVIGCGLGTGTVALELFTALLDALPIRPDFPVILDADALNMLGLYPDLQNARFFRNGRHQVVMTPHPAEFSRVMNVSVEDALTETFVYAHSRAHSRGMTVVFKDAHTIVGDFRGDAYICPFGNAGMATGGSGDVLAGIIGSLAVQNRHRLGDTFNLGHVAAAGVALHALSGDVAAKIHGEYAMTPSDIIDAMGEVTRQFSNTGTVIEK